MDLGRHGTTPPESVRFASQPDIMNDPAYATNTGSHGKGVDEPDTCRICRGEGSEEEQLFYPCKCSGSIKFVHQACLMEWLSHSQKKYCELCKTPFKFTKLYDPDMPQELPAPVFLKELVIHCGRTLLTWLRLVLVAFIWLGWLPWSMRAVWRGLFWLADGHWPNADALLRQPVTIANQTLNPLVAEGTSPASPVFVSDSPGASLSPGGVLPRFLPPGAAIFNTTNGEPLIYTIVKKLVFRTIFSASSNSSASSSASLNNSTIPQIRRMRQPSWLSDVAFLKKLTPYATLNNILIDTLEGQIITLSVVISFIVVFLIREWVVQQQPPLNIGEGEREAAAQVVADAANRRAQNARHDNEAAQEEPEAAEEAPNTAPENDDNTPISEPESSNWDMGPTTGNEPEQFGAGLVNPQSSHHDDALPGPSSAFAEPESTPVDPSTSETFDNDRHQLNSPIPLHAFKDLWVRGSGNPTEILRIIEHEGRQEELSWIVSAMKRLESESEGTEQSTAQLHPREFGADGVANTATTINGIDTHAVSTTTFGTSTSQTDNNSPGISPSMTFGGDSSNAQPFSPSLPNFEGITPSRSFDPQPGPSQQPQSYSSHPTTSNGDNLDALQIPDAESNSWDSQPIPHINEPSPENNAATASQPAENIIPTPPPNIESNDSVNTPQTLAERVAEWCWGDIPEPYSESEYSGSSDEDSSSSSDDDDEDVVHMGEVRDLGRQQNAQQRGAGAGQPGADQNDADAVDDADDLEGVMELIGMQGPIFGLLQNGVFSAVLITVTVTIGIWLPYIWGKFALVLLTNPIRLLVALPLGILSVVADVVADTIIGSFGYVVFCVNVLVRFTLSLLGRFIPALGALSAHNAVTSASLSLIDDSSQRLKQILLTLFNFHESELPVFSVISHRALHIHQARIATIFYYIFSAARLVVYDLPLSLIHHGPRKALEYLGSFDPNYMRLVAMNATSRVGELVSSFLMWDNWLSFKVPGSGGQPPVPLDYDLAHWDTKDRIIAILIGYCFASLGGLVYLRIHSYISGTRTERRVEGPIADALQQAGGVMKVILIIGIEMIVFPLYCGILLDFALMPLFENATPTSRTSFTMESPMTSLFVHWFIGTCYMFHFALFVSMCRKIMRSGVLYFIRDPDDPTFHPVRDVLERNVTTQLRKIAFSALVYGALVVICLGGVVWGLSFAFHGVLPIHWSSNEPVLEFPVDLLFYNFIMPLAIRSVRPSKGLNKLYDWWFHKCARMLRLTDFLFGERRTDEEGYFVYRGDSDYSKTGDDKGKEKAGTEKGPTRRFIRNGRFVRTPASDQVRIPKGGQVFLEVTEDNEPTDGNQDHDEGLHGKKNDMFAKVYIPPRFKMRIAAFILLIWVFAAATGVGSTIVPLVIGRKMISSLFPDHVRMNDIYAFSAGIYTMGGLLYFGIRRRKVLRRILYLLRPIIDEPSVMILPSMYQSATWLGGLAYVSAAFALLLPSLFALVTELYFLIPLHTYLGGDQAHVIHFVQDWTLGVLYVRMALRFILWNTGTRPAMAINAIPQNGWLYPEVRLATRAFIIPATAAALVAILVPLPIGFFTNTIFFYGASEAVRSQVYRYCYPGTLLAALSLWAIHLLRRKIGHLRVNIRDDVYLIGERLHNFGEKRARDVGSARRMITS